ncbi:MAG: imidazole glycerol phosphate synthase subunit HisH [Methylophilales bacterium]|jgi:imidazole glycerol-phosphate synthase subunit HisH|nr:imidazole glycerol phosphate synthase subunit HisH [Pseudomonadota bacterium]NQW35084.1 imidazole glycerol phosphate synthase subunit HisH [Methylophilales bacterium]|tara:strand:- start:7404 stop:8015 length:612 start_codon:yes stop_codon:yes gene_type:complete
MIAIIDYGMGNLRSVHNAFKFIAPQIESVVTSDPAIISKADRIVFPGQGAMPDCIRELEKRGLREIVKDSATSKPFLGICIGLQMLFDESEEGDVQGLGIFRGNVKRFKSFNNIKIPHMGWNEVYQETVHPIWENIGSAERFYFVHSYYVEEEDSSIKTGTANYGDKFTAAVAYKNIFAVQFHPEKSAEPGLQLLKNFISWTV